ncbi:Hypothetical protein D9617_19g103000 [Elsinoe fawcettii]|nr:Hypothetical protein D9617_19g103000 [Elsinoe fawcettii]
MYLQPLDHYLSDGVHESCTTINSSQEVINLSTIGIGEDGYLGVAYNETDSETKGPNKLADPGLVANGKADYYDPSCVVSISRSTTDIIQTLARRFFHHQTLDLTRFPNGVNKNITASGAMPALRKVFTDGLPSDLNNKHLEALFFNGNASLASVDAYAKGIADALTIHMRMYPVPGMKSNQPSIGIVQEIKTCAHARWVWLTLPVLLVIFNIGFLAAVILDNRRLANDKRWPGIIKSSPLGLFVYGPIIPAMENYHGPKDGVAMEYAAREVTTTLERRRAGINEKESD